MSIIGFIVWIVVGGVAGYIAERVMDEEHNLLVNVGLGIAGSFVINLFITLVLSLPGGQLIAQLVTGVIGACLLVWGYREYKRRG